MEEVCCICFESIDNIDNDNIDNIGNCCFTNCCNNKIHKYCLIQWFVSKEYFTCPLCNNNNIRVPLYDLLSYLHWYSPRDTTNKKIVVDKLNKLIQKSDYFDNLVIKVEYNSNPNFQNMEIENQVITRYKPNYLYSCILAIFTFLLVFMTFNFILNNFSNSDNICNNHSNHNNHNITNSNNTSVNY